MMVAACDRWWTTSILFKFQVFHFSDRAWTVNRVSICFYMFLLFVGSRFGESELPHSSLKSD